ncbi:MAG: AraC family transcriptional regulator [Oscillospiraceae bacterium]|nr:AraC family transcriptional regulator [Oscillospiraceae bacterium]
MKNDKPPDVEHNRNVLGVEMVICVGAIALYPPHPKTMGLFFMTDGEGILQYNQTEFSMRRNMAALCSTCNHVYLRCDKLSHLLCVWLDARDAGDSFSFFRMRNNLSDDTAQQLRTIASELSADKIRYLSEGCVQSILSQFLSCTEDFQSQLTGVSRIAQSAKDILDMRFAENLTLDDLTQKLQIGKSKLIHDFKLQWSVTPIEYLLGRRLEESARLLVETTTSIEAIAEQVGFRGVSYFSSRFKRRYGLPPSAYRLQNRFILDTD